MMFSNAAVIRLVLLRFNQSAMSESSESPLASPESMCDSPISSNQMKGSKIHLADMFDTLSFVYTKACIRYAASTLNCGKF